MKQWYIFAVAFLFSGICLVSAEDRIIMKNGSTFGAKVVEVSTTEIKYKRVDHLDGPTYSVPVADVHSIKYENGREEVISYVPAPTDMTGSYNARQLGEQTPLQIILNALPAIRIAGNNLKFQFGGDSWTATVNGENFSAGTIELEDNDGGIILNLKQTHIWPAAAGRAVGRVANMVPGGGAVGSVLDTAGSIAGAAVGAVEAPGPVIVLEYKAGPPAKLSYSRRDSERSTRAAAAPDPEAGHKSKPEREPRKPTREPRDPDAFYWGINGNPGGALLEGTSFGIELGKGRFNSEINFIFPSLGGLLHDIDKGFGVLATFNGFWPSRIGGGYLGGGLGLVYQHRYGRYTKGAWYTEGYFDEFIFSFGANGGYKFVMPIGLSLRIGGYVGLAFGYADRPVNVHFKPDLSVGWSF